MSKDRLSYEELNEYRDRIISCYRRQPVRVKMPDSTFELTENELRLLAHFEAAVVLLNRKGLLKEGVAENIIEIFQPDYVPVGEGISSSTTVNGSRK